MIAITKSATKDKIDKYILALIIVHYIKDITWLRGDTKFPVKCWKIFHEWAQRRKGCLYMVGHLFQNYDTIYVRFFPRILAIIPATRYTCVFLPRILTFFLTNAHIYAHKKAHIKQACGIWGHRKSSYKRHRIIPSAKNPFMYDGAEK